jgi:hypothetical protein
MDFGDGSHSGLTVLLTQVQPIWGVSVFRWFHGWIFGLNPDPVNLVFDSLHLSFARLIYQRDQRHAGPNYFEDSACWPSFQTYAVRFAATVGIEGA